MQSSKGLLILSLLHILPALVHSQAVARNSSLTPSQCLGRSCYPATGNLLVGRENRLQASSTCGLQYPERYCVVGDVSDVKKCFRCDSRLPWSESNPNSHNITNLVTTFSKDRLRRWWQAENGQQEAFIQLDLDAEFHFTHLIITFKTFRPKAMFIERSFDFGKSWLPYRYFAEDCRKSFPNITMGPVQSLKNPVICEEKYSQVLPASGGEVVFRVIEPHMKIDNPYSQEVQDLLKLTNLRVIFQQLHTLGDDLIDQRLEINEKYYYAVYDMVVRGSCSCYGHASRCVPSDDEDGTLDYMENDGRLQYKVHSKCECTHNTQGKNCDLCKDFYHDLPWAPATSKDTGECKKCECHEHATKCHFDAAIYISSGNVSGGVCDDCMHNTDGLHCELCKSYFYQDPTKDLRDPSICQPCDCDPVGTENNGECEMRNDPANGLIAGQCRCKRNVGGARCEECIAGYWDFTEDGCRECECNTLGTFGNRGCNQYTGHCNCKRFVAGRNCDQCVPQYWGLSSSVEGCQPCGCDIGGSYDNFCDAVSGQCNCKPGVTGRACDQPTPGFFVPDLDYLRYEAELADGTANTQVVIREQVPGAPVTWTGPGFMRAYEGESITFEVDNIPYSMSYDIIIRYETQMPQGWDDVRVVIARPGSPDRDGPCGNARPEDDYPGASLSDRSRHHIVRPQICFEKGKTYYVTLNFEKYASPFGTSDANILIDSIALIPVYEDIPVRMDENPLNPAQIIYCNNLEYDAMPVADMPDLCRRYVFSVGTAIQNKTFECDCNPTGSESNICDPIGGHCTCKPNVGGRKCDVCTFGNYGFGPSGCSPCNCDGQGAQDKICDQVTGECRCFPNIRGRQCDICKAGMYRFPQCVLCQCNGHAAECEDRTGTCINCQDNTQGESCENCLNGYYGDPSLGSAIPCRKCMCPGGEGSGYQHADTCSLDARSKEMICDCPVEFAGNQCQECAINHYGNPQMANGTCTSCAEGCNYNIDMYIPESCDPVDGRCLLCQYNTEGDNCEHCASGYHGSAPEHSCVACTCNPLGSNRTADVPCDRVTGKCPCLPNVIGDDCGECAVDHWKLASGEGCEYCDCDDEGSESSACNEFDGQCNCTEGRGGRRCDQCTQLFYGDPTIECYPCDCNVDGSEEQQCDPYTGQCPCLDGITGQKCDKCDRGTTGDLPNCVPCGECFDDWDNIIKSLRVKTDELIAQVNATKTEGVVGVYDDEFKAMEDKLLEISNILDSLNRSEANMDSVDANLEDISRMLMDAVEAMKTLKDNFGATNAKFAETETSLFVLNNQIEELIEHAKRQKKTIDDVIEVDINGAYQTILSNENRSKEALLSARDAQVLVDESLLLQNDTIQHLQQEEAEFERLSMLNDELLSNASVQVDRIQSKTLEDINKQVCDMKSPFAAGVFCDDACGGGGCTSCGEGDSCTEGAQGKVSTAKTVTERAQVIADNKTGEAEAVKAELTEANEKANRTLDAAVNSRNAAEQMVEDLISVGTNMADVLDRIGKLLNEPKTTPEEVVALAEEVLAMSIPSETLDEISSIAIQINETIQNLTNIEQILNETGADLAISKSLKERAENASRAADLILEQVNDLNSKLSDAMNAQNESKNAIEKANNDVDSIKASLKTIGDVMTASTKKTTELYDRIQKQYDRVDEMSKIATASGEKLRSAKGLAGYAETNATLATQIADSIKSKYAGVSEQVVAEYEANSAAHDRAVRLKDRALSLASSLSTSYASLQTMSTQLTDNARSMTDIQKEIDKLTLQMDEHIANLTRLENHHNKCEFTKSTVL